MLQKKKRAKSSFAAPMQTPKANECLVNFGMHVLQTGQWKPLKALSILQWEQFICGFYK